MPGGQLTPQLSTGAIIDKVLAAVQQVFGPHSIKIKAKFSKLISGKEERGKSISEFKGHQG